MYLGPIPHLHPGNLVPYLPIRCTRRTPHPVLRSCLICPVSPFDWPCTIEITSCSFHSRRLGVFFVGHLYFTKLGGSFSQSAREGPRYAGVQVLRANSLGMG